MLLTRWNELRCCSRRRRRWRHFRWRRRSWTYCRQHTHFAISIQQRLLKKLLIRGWRRICLAAAPRPDFRFSTAETVSGLIALGLHESFVYQLTTCSFSVGATPVRDNYNLKSHKYVCITTYQPNTKSNPNHNPNPNPTNKHHAIVNIQLNIVTCPTNTDKFIRDMLLHRLCDFRL